MLTERPDQAESRQTATYTDQHGRPWLTVLDTRAKTTGKTPRIAPCVPFAPKGWSAPLVVPQKYLDIPDGSLSTLVIAYDRWIADTREASRDVTQNLHTAAMQLYGQTAGAAIQNPTPELLNVVGRSPIPLAFLQAAKQGVRWVLGLPQTNGQPYPVPAWAAPLLDQLSTTARDLDEPAFADETFTDEVDDLAIDAALDLDEAFDPDALGGHVEPTRRRSARRVAA